MVSLRATIRRPLRFPTSSPRRERQESRRVRHRPASQAAARIAAPCQATMRAAAAAFNSTYTKIEKPFRAENFSGRERRFLQRFARLMCSRLFWPPACLDGGARIYFPLSNKIFAKNPCIPLSGVSCGVVKTYTCAGRIR